MDYPFEEYFVQTFIKRVRRERLLYELTSKKKRHDGLERFCHQAEEVLDASRIIMKGEDLDRRSELLSFVSKHDEVCYMISPDPDRDDIVLSLEDAVNAAETCLDAVIIIGNGFALVYGEAMKDGRDKFLLTDNGPASETLREMLKKDLKPRV